MFFLVNSLILMAFVLAETFYQSTWKIEAIYSLAIFLPLLSLTVRRLHDTRAFCLVVVSGLDSRHRHGDVAHLTSLAEQATYQRYGLSTA